MALFCHFRASYEIRLGCSGLYPVRYWKTFKDRGCTTSLAACPTDCLWYWWKSFSLYLEKSSPISAYSCYLSSHCHTRLWKAQLPPLSHLPLATWVAVVPLKQSLYQAGWLPLSQLLLTGQCSSLHHPDGLCWTCSNFLMPLLNWGHKSVCNTLGGL